MIIEIPNENSIVKWKNDDKDEWKVAEISDLIKVYESPKGDLISRKALKKELDKKAFDLANGGMIFIESINHIIDNAPTVEEVSIIEFKEPLPLVKAQKIVKALSKRPHGEWILNEDENPECPFCHHSYIWFGNFCSNCGADMR